MIILKSFAAAIVAAFTVSGVASASTAAPATGSQVVSSSVQPNHFEMP
jgi:hypothetical protein